MSPYKFTVKLSATPQLGAITELYRQIYSNIDQELIRNMPERSLMVLLSSLLEVYIGRQGLIPRTAKEEAKELLNSIREDYGI